MKPANTRLVALALAAAALVSAAACRRSNPTPSNPPPGGGLMGGRAHGDGGGAAVAHAGDARAAAANDPSQGGPPPPALDPPAAGAEFREAATYLPQGEVSGWRQSGSVMRLPASNLSDAINGEAPSYEQYGVQRFARTDYRRPGTRYVATVNVFEFEQPLGAFGRYSLMVSDARDPATLESQAARVGGGGYQGTTQLVFWKGRVLVQISLSDESDNADEAELARTAQAALPQLAAAVEQRISGDTAQPASPLPSQGLVWGGATYLANRVFAVEDSGPAWVGHYRAQDGKRYRLAVFERPSAAGAQQVATRLRGRGASAVPGLGDEAFVTAGERPIAVARRGNTVFAVADPEATGLPTLDRDGRLAVLRAALAAPAPAAPARDR